MTGPSSRTAWSTTAAASATPKPACGVCPVADLCPSYGIGETNEQKARKLMKYEMAPRPRVTCTFAFCRAQPAASYRPRGTRSAPSRTLPYTGEIAVDGPHG